MAQEVVIFQKYDDVEFPWAYAWGQDYQGLFEVDVHLMTQEDILREMNQPGVTRIEFEDGKLYVYYDVNDINLDGEVVQDEVWDRFMKL